MSLPAALVAVGVAATANALLTRLAVARVAARERPTRAVRRRLLVGGVLAGVGTLLALALADAPLRATTARFVAGPPALVTLLVWTEIAAAWCVVVFVGYLAAVPAIGRARGVDLDRRRAAARMARWLGGLLLLFVGVAGTAFASLAVLPPLAVVLGLGVVFAVGDYLAGGAVIRLVASTRAPTPEERERLDGLLSQADFVPDHVRVLDLDGEEQVFVRALGPPGRRRLYVADTLWARFDADEAAGLLAVAGERARGGWAEARTGGALVVALAFGAVALGVGLLEGVAVALVGVVALYLVVRRFVFRADAQAADRLGADAVAGALERRAELHGESPDAGRLSRLASVSPSVGERVDRLRARSAD